MEQEKSLNGAKPENMESKGILKVAQELWFALFSWNLNAPNETILRLGCESTLPSDQGTRLNYEHEGSFQEARLLRFTLLESTDD